MAGKLCTGQLENNIGAARLSQSKAYCEGITYRSGGTAIAKPKASNPHVAGTPDAISWDLGWDLVGAAAGGVMAPGSTGCCALPSGTILA